MGIRSEYTIRVKTVGDTVGAFAGDLSVYGNVDDVGDVVEHGFFDRSLASTRHYPLLWQHDMAQPIGSFDVTDSDGPALKIEGRFNLATQKGREAYELLRARDIDGLSIGYTVSDYKYDGDGIRHLYDGELMEGSLVTFPANRLARAQAKQRMIEMSKSRFAECKFLTKLSDEERAEAIEELEALDRSANAEEEESEDKEEPGEEEEKAKKEGDPAEDEEELKDLISQCKDLLERLQDSPDKEE